MILLFRWIRICAAATSLLERNADFISRFQAMLGPADPAD